jgi:hypothetical protein
MSNDQIESDLNIPQFVPVEPADPAALMRLFDGLSRVDRLELLDYAINLARKPKE